MQTLLDLNLGYVTCDICGEGQNRITIWRDTNASAYKAPFKVARKSQCYGNLEQAGMTRDQVVEWLEAQHFLVATRYARKNYRRFLVELRKGAHDPAEPTPALDPSALIAPSSSTLDHDFESLLIEPLYDPAGVAHTASSESELIPAGSSIRQDGATYTEGVHFFRECNSECCRPFNEAVRRELAREVQTTGQVRTFWVDNTSDYSGNAPRLSDLVARQYTISIDPSSYGWTTPA